MQAIVCVSKSWGIGCENSLLFHISADLKRFRALTVGKTVVLGRNTLLTFPGGKPLKDRHNVVITRHNVTIEGAEVVHTAQEALELVSPIADEVVIIGGASVYTAFLPHCDHVRVTKVDADPEADAFFPNLDRNPHWHIASQSEWMEENGLRFCFVDYERN